MAWYLNPALTGFRNAVNVAYPDRDRKSDGTIADEHHGSDSDHQPDAPPEEEVDAWDMDVELNGVGRPYAADVEHLKTVFQNHPSSRYWIHNRQIARRVDEWERKNYTGTNPHTEHVHWNTREEFDESQFPWVIGAANMATVDDIWRLLHDGLRPGPNQTVGGVPIAWLPRQFHNLFVEISALKALILTISNDDPDVAAILAGVDKRLEEMQAELEANIPDLVVDETKDRLAE